MKKTVYDLVSKAVKTFSKSDIVTKKVNNHNKVLYYERSQHLTFLFQKHIQYEEHIQNKIKAYLKSGDLVFDIGANIGQYALPFSEVVGPSGTVYSFEPDFKNYAFLQFNVNINNCTNIRCFNYGIGKENTQQEFFRDTETGGRKSSFKRKFVEDSFKGLTENVTIKSLDALVTEFGQPNLIKIDAEGCEDDIISGLTIDLNDCVFAVEVREDTKHFIFDYFTKKGYDCIWIDHKDLPINNAEDIPDYVVNLIFKRSTTTQ
ncbi:FkbM family methyltransferase [Mangrovimonas sp. TPBH4]|uniref:FkbM family methyltransferase n=1 Tax=Mangrovimonas sp. TPBH4 TaxID=1645914 RepID=UPI0006B51BDC|nr:FkbM family methyltransferase [Mangrovimonas sp. TPBH4]